ncbi:MAG TPA: hypothetical protein VL154_10000 [Acetobacteraceae bacterium]|jgi:hypothetical protein|nr:hypothetical protein [Acetobacteraceae bacterium]
MEHARLGEQPDLFTAPHDNPAARQPANGGLSEPPDAAFVDGIRQELMATLAKVQAATDGLPWRDLTAAYLAEMRFRSVSRWLPATEAERLVAMFDAELDRLYALLDAVAADA